ncbi:MAG: hypothetical protein IPQ07_20845 [Myxococcales bacterium]|nr:hypothetical protein [Myxococcales bacterium]
MTPVELTYSLMTRSLRVSHASVAKRDPHLARGVELLLAAKGRRHERSAAFAHGAALLVGGVRIPSRIVVAPPCGMAPDDDALVALGGAAAAGAGLVVTPALPASALASDDAIVAWRRIVEFVHAKGAQIALRIGSGAMAATTAEHATFAGFDVLVLDAGNDPQELEALPREPAPRRAPSGERDQWLGAAVRDKPAARAAVVGHAAQLVRAGANVLWVSSPGDGSARLAAAPLADRLRNELSVAVCVDGADAVLPDLDAAIAGGRADLVVVDRLPAHTRRGS